MRFETDDEWMESGFHQSVREVHNALRRSPAVQFWNHYTDLHPFTRCLRLGAGSLRQYLGENAPPKPR